MSIITDELVFEPMVGVHNETGEMGIVVKVIDLQNRILDVQVFDAEEQYRILVEDELQNLRQKECG
jgi:hypothetical protein